MHENTLVIFSPACDGQIHVERVKFDATAASSRSFGRENGRAASAKWVQDDVAVVCHIEDRADNHCNWLDGRMDIETTRSTPLRKAVRARVVPDVGAIAAENPRAGRCSVCLSIFRDSSDGRSATRTDGRSDWPTVGLAQPSV